MQPTATRIRDDIHNLREQAETLEELATRRIRIPHDGARGLTLLYQRIGAERMRDQLHYTDTQYPFDEEV